MNLSLEWTNHLKSEDEKERFESLVRNSTQVLSRLSDILLDREAAILKQEVLVADYDSPAWPYKQAHRNGARSELKKLKDLLSFLKDKK